MILILPQNVETLTQPARAAKDGSLAAQREEHENTERQSIGGEDAQRMVAHESQEPSDGQPRAEERHDQADADLSQELEIERGGAARQIEHRSTQDGRNGQEERKTCGRW